MPSDYRYNVLIAQKVKDGILRGLSMTVIIDSCSAIQDCPGSRQTFYKVYGKDIAEARAEFQSYLGDAARKRIDEGSDKILELALRSKAGWNPQETINVKVDDEPDESTSALEDLMTLLNKKTSISDDSSE